MEAAAVPSFKSSSSSSPLCLCATAVDRSVLASSVAPSPDTRLCNKQAIHRASQGMVHAAASTTSAARADSVRGGGMAASVGRATHSRMS
eukprot:scaffold6568_cov126-Isochrysis_galbana.AAC.3